MKTRTFIDKLNENTPIRLEINVKMYKNNEHANYRKDYDFKTEDDFRKFFMRIEDMLKALDKIEGEGVSDAGLVSGSGNSGAVE